LRILILLPAKHKNASHFATKPVRSSTAAVKAGMNDPAITMEHALKQTDRIAGLDSIRFVCALFVFFGHGAAFYFPNAFEDGSVANMVVSSFFHNFWSGPSAVIVFFVISGFCIHYPYSDLNTRLNLKVFYTRRLLRLLVPVIIAVPLSGLMGARLTLLHDSILWSLLAEFIYYMLYPGLRIARIYLKAWRVIIAVSFIAAICLAATNPTAANYPSYGSGFNWILGLPCWLLGCLLAESVHINKLRQVSSASIWVWRTVILGAAFICRVLKFHSPIGYPWTLNIFAVMVFFWLQREIVYRRDIAPFRFLEWAGLWSYSLYLLHAPSGVLFFRLFPSAQSSVLSWTGMILFVFGICYIYYIIVERPSHIIARGLARKLQ
jgi:peptidoglycan/LPS O-acetylase OafA/YrhL